MLELISFTGAEIYAWIILPLLIFIARICDVSIGTIRIIFVSKGIKYLATILGFFEILIWLLAISQIMQNLSNAYYYLFYAGGFATGNFVGILIDEKISIGTVGIRIITRREAKELIDNLRQAKYGVTVVDAEGSKGRVKVIFTIVNRQNIQDVVRLVKKYNPKAFYSVEDVRFVNEKLSPLPVSWYKRKLFNPVKSLRKGK